MTAQAVQEFDLVGEITKRVRTRQDWTPEEIGADIRRSFPEVLAGRLAGERRVNGRKPYADLQLTVYRPWTEAEKAQAVREVLAARLGVPLDKVPGIDDQNIRELVALIEEARGAE